MAITEEKITIAILDWLQKNSWNVLAYDFPQSGTGISLKPNNSSNFKNRGTIIPDIIAIKGAVVVFFENKNRYYATDFFKIKMLKEDGFYSESIARFLSGFDIDSIYYGIGLPVTSQNKSKVELQMLNSDFIISYESGRVFVYYQKYEIFI